MRHFNRFWTALALSIVMLQPVIAADPVSTRAQALKAIEQDSPQERFAGVVRLAEVGLMADADRLVARLRDESEEVRLVAASALWQIWGRSGDTAIDALYQRGVQQMETSQFPQALTTFNEIVRRKPAFAEGWNKRATLHYLMGNFERSLKDCDEVVKRNPNHFGALSGYGQIYLNLGDLEKALAYFEKALAVNPNLAGATITIRQLQLLLQEKQRKST